MAKASRIRGVGRQVRQTTFIHPSNAGLSQTQKVKRVLGPKARAQAASEADEALREQLRGTLLLT